MRFMILLKSDELLEAGAMPDEKAIAAMDSNGEFELEIREVFGTDD